MAIISFEQPKLAPSEHFITKPSGIASPASFRPDSSPAFERSPPFRTETFTAFDAPFSETFTAPLSKDPAGLEDWPAGIALPSETAPAGRDDAASGTVPAIRGDWPAGEGSSETFVTSPAVRMTAPADWARRARASTTSEALCETGKALSPRSTTDSRPAELSSRSISRCGVRLKNAGFRKFGLVRTWREKSSQSLRFVKLHRPLPVIMIFLPGRGIFSSTSTEGLSIDEAAPYAAISPEAPPPIIIMS